MSSLSSVLFEHDLSERPVEPSVSGSRWLAASGRHGSRRVLAAAPRFWTVIPLGSESSPALIGTLWCGLAPSLSPYAWCSSPASLGAVLFLRFGFSVVDSAVAALGLLTVLALYNAVSGRRRDRAVGERSGCKLGARVGRSGAPNGRVRPAAGGAGRKGRHAWRTWHNRQSWQHGVDRGAACRGDRGILAAGKAACRVRSPSTSLR